MDLYSSVVWDGLWALEAKQRACWWNTRNKSKRLFTKYIGARPESVWGCPVRNMALKIVLRLNRLHKWKPKNVNFIVAHQSRYIQPKACLCICNGVHPQCLCLTGSCQHLLLRCWSRKSRHQHYTWLNRSRYWYRRNCWRSQDLF